MEVLLIALLLLALVFLGEPVFVIIGAVGLLCFFAVGIDLSAMIVELYRLATIPALIAIPLFTFSGYVLAESQTPKRLVNLAQALVGWMPGDWLSFRWSRVRFLRRLQVHLVLQSLRLEVCFIPSWLRNYIQSDLRSDCLRHPEVLDFSFRQVCLSYSTG